MRSSHKLKFEKRKCIHSIEQPLIGLDLKYFMIQIIIRYLKSILEVVIAFMILFPGREVGIRVKNLHLCWIKLFHLCWIKLFQWIDIQWDQVAIDPKVLRSSFLFLCLMSYIIADICDCKKMFVIFSALTYHFQLFGKIQPGF